MTLYRSRSSFFGAVFYTSPEPLFFDFWTPKPPKMEPKWNQNSQKTGADGLPEKHTHNCAYFFHFSLFSKTSMFQKHGKKQYRTMFFKEPSPAQHLKTKHRKTSRKSLQNPLKMVPGGLPKPLPKKYHKKTPQKSKTYRKCLILGCPKNKEATKNGRTFRHFFGSGRPWDPSGAPPGPKVVPKPPMRASRTPPGVDF